MTVTLQSPPGYLQAGTYSALSDRLHLITARTQRNPALAHGARGGFFPDRFPDYGGTGMDWAISSCAGVIPNTFTVDGGDYAFVNPSNVIGSFAASSPTQNRYDILGFQVKDNFYDASGLNQVTAAVIQGANSAGTPVDPALPASFVPVLRAVVNAGVTTVTMQDLRARTVSSMGIMPVQNNTERATLGSMALGFTIWNMASQRLEVANGVGGWIVPTYDQAGGLLAAPTHGASNIAFGGEVVIDNNTFTHTQGRYEELVFTSSFSLNATGVVLLRIRYVAGAGPITSGSTLMYQQLPTGTTLNDQTDVTRVLNETFRALATGTYTVGVTAQAASGASSGTMNGNATDLARDLYVKDATRA